MYQFSCAENGSDDLEEAYERKRMWECHTNEKVSSHDVTHLVTEEESEEEDRVFFFSLSLSLTPVVVCSSSVYESFMHVIKSAFTDLCK